MVLSYVIIYKFQTIRGRVRPSRKPRVPLAYVHLARWQDDNPVIPIRIGGTAKEGGKEAVKRAVTMSLHWCHM